MSYYELNISQTQVLVMLTRWHYSKNEGATRQQGATFLDKTEFSAKINTYWWVNTLQLQQ